MPRIAPPLSLPLAVALVLAGPAGPLAARPEPAATPAPSGPTETEVEAHLAAIKAARSYPEANPHFEALAEVEAAFPKLEALAADPKLHPEVQFYLKIKMFRMPGERAVDFAARALAEKDADLRAKAVRRLIDSGGPRHTDALLDAILREKKDDVRADLLFALGRADKAKAVPFLEGWLKKGVHPDSLNGATRALGKLGATQTAPKILAVLDDTLPDRTVDEVLLFLHEVVGQPDADRVVAMAADAREPLRLYAINQLPYSLPNPEPEGLRARMQAAASSALDSADPLMRWRAVRSFSSLHESPCMFIAEPEAIRRVLAAARDPIARVRLAAIEGLHNTVLRRGLMIPMSQPSALDGETMRMLRWPSDWLTFPALVDLLDDPDQRVREKAVWELGIATGYWYGYGDIRLLGAPVLSPDVKAEWRAMVEEMAGKSPERFVADRLDAIVGALARAEQVEAHPHWMRGVKLLTGSNFGWSARAPVAERRQAVERLQQWWRENRDKPPYEWLLDRIRTSRFESIDETNLHVLARWATRPVDFQLFNPKQRQENPDDLARRLIAWWESARPVSPSSPPSSR